MIEIFPAPPWWLAAPAIAVAAPLAVLTTHYFPRWSGAIAVGVVYGYSFAQLSLWLWRRRMRRLAGLP